MIRLNDRGSTLVEVALLLPILLVLTIGIAELGRAIYSHHALSKSVRDAGRFLARVADPTDAGFQSLAANYVRTGSFDGSADPLVGQDPAAITVGFQITEFDNSAHPQTFYGTDTIRAVRVEARYAYQSGLLSAFGLSGPDGIAMAVAHIQRHTGE